MSEYTSKTIHVVSKEWVQKPIEGKEDTLWYGDDIILFNLNNGGCIAVSAYGDVDIEITDRKTQDELWHCHDKYNTGLFGKDTENYWIKNDEELQDAIDPDGSGPYAIQVWDNNWLEWNYIDSKGLFVQGSDIYGLCANVLEDNVTKDLETLFTDEEAQEIVEAAEDFVKKHYNEKTIEELDGK